MLTVEMASRNEKFDVNNGENSLATDAEPIEDPRPDLVVAKVPETTDKSQKKGGGDTSSKFTSGDKNGSKKKFNFTGFPFDKGGSNTPPNFPNFMKPGACGSSNFTAFQIGYANNLHIGNNFTYNQSQVNVAAPKSGTKQKPREPQKPKGSKVPVEILTSKASITEDMMLLVKGGDLGYRWKDFGQLLSLSNGLLETVEYEHKQYGLNEIVFQVMIKWKEKLGKNATMGKLATVLDEIGRDDLASSLLNCDSTE